MKTKLLKTVARLKHNKRTYLPNLRSRQFIENFCRHLRTATPNPVARAAMGFIRERISSFYASTSRVPNQSRCFLSTRARGGYQRFGISRLKLRSLTRTGVLLGLRKAS